VRGYGFGLIGNIVVGIVGALIAGWLLPKIGFVLAPAMSSSGASCCTRKRRKIGRGSGR